MEVYFMINILQIKQMSGISEEISEDTTQDNKKDICECVREIQRVFKSVVQGSEEEDAERDETVDENHKIFDDMFVIIWMNKLLMCEKKLFDSNQEIEKRILPIADYDKINKLLRNFVIHSGQTIEETSIESYV